MYRARVPVADREIVIEADTGYEFRKAIIIAMELLDRQSRPESTSTLPRTKASPDQEATLGAAAGGLRANAPASSLDYRGARMVGDFLYIALNDLGVAKGRRAFTPKEIYEHVVATGGDPRMRARDRLGTVRQALRNDERFIKEGTGYRVVDWQSPPPSEGAASAENPDGHEDRTPS